MIVKLTNDIVEVAISTMGAELQSIRNVRTNHEYLWQGDKAFWGRRSPVLFPIVGAVWNGEYRCDGHLFHLGQHGFARDMEFSLMENAPEDEAWFELEADEHTLALYPFRFRLEIGYALHADRLSVMWRVTNKDSQEISFQIGAHPAFNYPDFNAEDPIHGYFGFNSRGPLHAEVIAEKGCIGESTAVYTLDDDHLMPITADTFSHDAVILPNAQVSRVSLLDKNKLPYITLLFKAPAVGLWSKSADAPFVCIEPWWGRADRVGYSGEFRDREYINHLAPEESFKAEYTIILDN